jgi:predicted GTPase
VIDGEHYAPVVRDALVQLPYEVVAALLVGGTEKLRGEEGYGVPLVASLDEAIAFHAPEVVVDLSDEPVLDPRRRFLLASRVLAAGLPYAGPDFRLEPPRFERLTLPSLAPASASGRPR